MIRKILFVLILCALTRDFSSFITHRSRRDADTCGVPKNSKGLIIRGQNFTRGAFPWIVALIQTRSLPPAFFCAGTLISKTFVISAAHCILQKNQEESEKLLPRQVRAFFGAHDLKNYLETGRFVLSPMEIHLHENWNPETTRYDSDLALLEFEPESISFNRFVQPICLWESEEEPAVTEGVVTGWGRSEDEAKDHEDIPKLVKALIQTNEDCFLDEGQSDHVHVSSKRTFCAGLRNGSGVCEGDSGGGLFIKVEGVSYLKGIVSSSPVNAHNGCDVSINAIYTNVLKFRGWIEDKIPTAAKKVFCFFSSEFSSLFGRYLNTCYINQTINSENFMLASPKNTSIESFDARENKHIEYLPRGIGEKFPNLIEFWAFSCGLTIVRDFYFKNMGKLEGLSLSNNQIKTIEPKAFDDLVSLRVLVLFSNLIETLDENLFVKMVKLGEIILANNKIKSLSPTTFKIPGNGKRKYVSLMYNVCINKYYTPHDSPLNQLEADLRTNCSQ